LKRIHSFIQKTVFTKEEWRKGGVRLVVRWLVKASVLYLVTL